MACTSFKTDPLIEPVPLRPGLDARVLKELELDLGPIFGYGDDGFAYESLSHLWEVEKQKKVNGGMAAVDPESAPPAFYKNAQKYWDVCEPTVEGMLGGFGCLTDEDVKGSNSFLEKVRQKRPNLIIGRAVDCGAGIGRVTKHFLLPLFSEVHLLEQSAPLIEKAPEYIGDSSRVTFLNIGMQAFDPSPDTYDVSLLYQTQMRVCDYV